MTTKVCSSCSENKTLDQFQPDSRYRLGVHGTCKACRSLYHKARNKNPTIRERANELRRARDRKEESRKYYQKNSEKVKARHDRWLEKNMPVKMAWNANRRAAKQNATPNWLSAIERARIQEFYDVAAAKTMQTGVQYHVDHIHPLKGDGYNGLHVPWNLQVITSTENARKNNKVPSSEAAFFWEDSI